MGFLHFFKKEVSKIEFTLDPTVLNDYVVFDLETTGLSRYYSEIVQISAIKVHNGQIIGTFNTLVKPNKTISPDAIAVHHITDEMVANAPSFSDAIDKFLRFVNGSILIGYNISGFDLHLLNNRLYFEKRRTLNASYVDVLHTARQLSLPDYKLTTLAEFYGYDTSGAHNALFDCELTDKCYRALSLNGYHSVVSEFIGPVFQFHSQSNLTQSNQAILILRSIMDSIVKDGVVEKSEFYELFTWVKENDNLKGEYPFDSISARLDAILEDGVVEQSELKELVGFIDEWLDPIGHARHSTITTLKDVHVVLTGDFECGSKSVVEKYVLEKGAIVDKSTTRKTQLVIVGALGSVAWVTGNYGNKIKKALENRAKGQSIEIITEYDFFKETSNL